MSIDICSYLNAAGFCLDLNSRAKETSRCLHLCIAFASICEHSSSRSNYGLGRPGPLKSVIQGRFSRTWAAPAVEVRETEVVFTDSGGSSRRSPSNDGRFYGLGRPGPFKSVNEHFATDSLPNKQQPQPGRSCHLLSLPTKPPPTLFHPPYFIPITSPTPHLPFPRTITSPRQHPSAQACYKGQHPSPLPPCLVLGCPHTRCD